LFDVLKDEVAISAASARKRPIRRQHAARDQWFTREYLKHNDTIAKMLKNHKVLPARDIVEKFFYFYGPYNAQINLKQFMNFEDPLDPELQRLPSTSDEVPVPSKSGNNRPT
jgi:hypothetical protein